MVNSMTGKIKSAVENIKLKTTTIASAIKIGSFFTLLLIITILLLSIILIFVIFFVMNLSGFFQ